MRYLRVICIALTYCAFFQFFSAFLSQKLHAQLPSQDTTAAVTDLLYAYRDSPKIDSYLYTLELEEKLSSISDDQKLAEYYKKLIIIASDMSDYNRLLKYVELGTTLNARINDLELQVYIELGKTYIFIMDDDQHNAEKTLTNIHRLLDDTDDPELIAFVNIYDLIFAVENNEYLENLARMIKQEKNLPTTPNGNKLRSLSLLAIGYNYAVTEDIENMLVYYKQALNHAKQYKLLIDRESVVYNFAVALVSHHKYDVAYEAYQILEVIMKQTNDMDNEFYLYSGLAYLEQKRGNLLKSNEYALQAVDPNTKGGSSYDISYLYSTIALNYAQLGQIDKAKEALELEAKHYTKHPYSAKEGENNTQRIVNAYITLAEGNAHTALLTLDQIRKEQLDRQSVSFKKALSETQSSLQILLEKQQTEEMLKDVETAYLRIIAISIILGAAGLLALFFMQRRYTQKLKKTMAEATSANQAKSDFLANMSHELRTPLNAILGFSEMMQHQVFGKLGTRQYEEYTDHIHSSGRHLLDIINDILDLSKVESGKLQLEEENIDLEEVFHEVHTILAPKAQALRQNIIVSANAYGTTLFADRRLLKQILLNLLSNSVKFTPKHGTLKLTSQMSEHGEIKITVTDTGVGMTPEELKVAMTPFGQAGRTLTRSHEGTGLGLPLVKDLVELHGGIMKITTEKHKGTRVRLCFPLERTVKKH